MTTSPPSRSLVLGTRGSLLARTQTGWVADRLRTAHPDLDIRVEIITTTGDRQQGQPLPDIGGKGLFTEELEQALRAGTIDLAVHSAKDLPTDLGEGLDVLAWPVREDPRDAWVSADGRPFQDVPQASTIGTSSLRRQAQLLYHRPDLHFVALRGNVDTRIRKVRRGDCVGAVLAMAGLNRAALAHEAVHPLDESFMVPAPGQGALALEGRIGDERVAAWLTAIHHEPTALAVSCERQILAGLDAGCRAPVGVLATLEADTLRCRAVVLDPRGASRLEAVADGPSAGWRDLAASVLGRLRANGADALIAAARQS